ncbi:unnamed protein product [Adineta ricciae]|uniref:F-box domain-containing protein n=1 Tax=Adineta ricciae TaxID=249248 RepID=A0A815YIN2_ADIRI|nr:unnamed protein product [Adineta ricciae]
MPLESLANELLLDIFECINAIDLFRAFYGLNTRFNELLLVHARTYHVDFQLASQHDFNHFCRVYLPLISRQVATLHLSDDDGEFLINQIRHADSIEPVMKILSNCDQMSSLTRLKITYCSCRNTDKFSDLIHHVWLLPKLTHCHLDFTAMLSPYSFRQPLRTSKTIEYLSMKTVKFTFKDLFALLLCTPNVRHVHATLFDRHASSETLPILPSISKLNLSTDSSLHHLNNIFQAMPNLSHVTLELAETSDRKYLNGHSWQALILASLSKIRVWRFFTTYSFHEEMIIEDHVEQILDTFRTPFYLDEHRWFVRCDWNRQITGQRLFLYTMPSCCRDIYVVHPSFQSKSTYPENPNVSSLDHICYPIGSDLLLRNGNLHLVFPNRIEYLLFRNQIPCVFLPKIGHVTIRLPTETPIWSFISTLTCLRSLNISLSYKTSLGQLQALINQTPRCHSLTVNNVSPEQLAQLDRIPAPLHRISIKDYCSNAVECSVFAASPLGRQCKVLSLDLTDRRNVLNLVNEMIQLRTLTCFCEDMKWRLDPTLIQERGNLATWLQDRLPATCSLSIMSMEMKKYFRISIQ